MILFQTIISLLLLAYGMFENEPEWVIAAGLYEIAKCILAIADRKKGDA